MDVETDYHRETERMHCYDKLQDKPNLLARKRSNDTKFYKSMSDMK